MAKTQPTRTPARPPGGRPTGGRPVPTKKQRRRGTTQLDRMLRPWWQAPWVLVGGGLGAVVVIVVVVILVINIAFAPAALQPENFGAAPASVLSAVTNPSASVVSAVGGGTGVINNSTPGSLISVSTSSLLTDSSGKPEIVYVGAEYCPYCAAERWAMIMALSRFGSFSGLDLMQSSSSDVDPSTHTFTFLHATYTSQYIAFNSNEVLDRNSKPLQAMSSQVSQLFTTYGQSPYQPSGPGYPFLDIANRFTLASYQYDPQILAGLSWDQIATDLSNSSSQVAQAIVGSANYLTAAICITTNDQPASACSSSTIQTLEGNLKSAPTVSPPASP